MPERERVAADDAWRVRIRMYRLGIGDCFLLSFTAADRSHHVLIDCGILQGSPSATQRIRKVAENVASVTGNRLDVLVATHEHWDHVSGFHDARDIFDAMQVDQVWVAWTENTRDAAAARLKEEKRQRLQALRMALAELALADSAEAQDVGGAIAQTLGFYGGPAAVDEGSFAFSEKTDLAMRAVTERSGGPLPTFCEPGDLMTPAWDDGMRVYVLGPPCDPERIRDLRAKAGADIYALAGADGLYVSALGAAARARSAGAEQDKISDDFSCRPLILWV